jgi:hypothetical protein
MSTEPKDPIRVKLSDEERDAFVAAQVAESERWAALSEEERLAELENADD